MTIAVGEPSRERDRMGKARSVRVCVALAFGGHLLTASTLGFIACVGAEPGAVGSTTTTPASDGASTSDTNSTTPGDTGATSGDAAGNPDVMDANAAPDGDAGASIGSSPVAWYAGDQGLVADGGSLVWMDSTGHGHHLVSVGPTPTVVNVNNKGSVKLTTPVAPEVSCLRVSDVVLPAARSMYAVATLSRWTNGTTSYSSTLLFLSGTIEIATVIDPGPSPKWTSGNVKYGYNANAIGDINVPKIFAVRDNGNSSLELSISSNDGFKGGAAVIGTYTNQPSGGVVNVGCRPSGNGYQWEGTVSEVVLYDRRLTDVEHQATLGYLKTKWSVVYP